MFIKSFLMFTLLALTTNSLYANEESGKELFEEAKCMSCHENEDFKHRAKKVNNFTKLSQSVAMCAYNNEVEWFDEDANEASLYLNNKFYFYKDIDTK